MHTISLDPQIVERVLEIPEVPTAADRPEQPDARIIVVHGEAEPLHDRVFADLEASRQLLVIVQNEHVLVELERFQLPFRHVFPELFVRICGRHPVGWYTRRVSANTHRLLREEGGFLYLSDAYNDDLPYWLPGEPRQPKLMRVGLYGRNSGHPARAGAPARILDDVLEREGVWVCRREGIGRQGVREHPGQGFMLRDLPGASP